MDEIIKFLILIIKTMSLRESGPSAQEMGLKPKETETGAEKEFNEYVLQMRQELEDAVVENASQESDLRTVFQKSLEINTAFENIIDDTQGNFDIDAVQEIVDKNVRLLRLPESKFSLHRLKELADKIK